MKIYEANVNGIKKLGSKICITRSNEDFKLYIPNRTQPVLKNRNFVNMASRVMLVSAALSRNVARQFVVSTVKIVGIMFICLAFNFKELE